MADASPKLRSDLTATAAEADGVAYVDVSDARAGRSFRFYDFEYALALQLNGQPVANIVAWASAAYGLDLTATGVGEFADRLAELGFLEAPADAADAAGAVVELVVDDLLVEESQPVSQLVSRAVSQAGHAPGAVELSAPTGTGWASNMEITVDDDGGERSRSTTDREMVAEPSVTETLMGFAGRSTVREMVAEPSTEEAAVNGQTMMGFAALADVPAAEPSRALVPIERRQPPPPETVQMAPFTDEAGQQRQERRPVAVRAQPRAADSRGLSLTAIMWIVVLIAAAAAVGYYVWSRQQGAPETRHVHVVAPRPAAVYRWFDAAGAIVDGDVRALSFASAGTVVEVLPARTQFGAGEVLARLQGAAGREAEVNRHRSRVVYYEQVRDSMKAAGNRSEQRQAELKWAQKKTLLDEAQAALDQVVVRATVPGEIVEIAAKPGASVTATTPVVRIKTGALRAEFALGSRDVEAASHLGFCRLEIVGALAGAAAPAGSTSPDASGAGATRFVDCKIGSPAASGRQSVELPAGTDLPVGQPLRLARSRYDGVFPVPRAAIVRVGDTNRVFVAGASGIAEARAVTLADAGPDEALVSQGLDVGDQVIADPPADLRDGEPVEIQK